MKCIGCSQPIKPSKAIESPSSSALVDNYTYRCKCGQEMTWTGRARTSGSKPETGLHRVGARITARGMTGTVVS